MIRFTSRSAAPLARWGRRTLWAAAALLLALPASRRLLAAPPAAAAASGLGLVALAAALDWLRRGDRSLLGRAPAALLGVAAPAVVLVAVSGGPLSPALGTAALWIAAYARRHGARAAVMTAAALCLASAAGWWALDAPAMGWGIAFAALLLAAVAAIAPQLPTARATATGARRPLVRGAALTGDHDAVGAARPADAAGPGDEYGGETDILTLRGYLDDVRDALGADEVVLWRWSASAEELRVLVIANRLRSGELRFPLDEGAALVQWAAHEGMAVTDDANGPPRLVAVAVMRGDALYGALSAYRAEGFHLTRTGVKDRATRSAAHIGTLLGLLDARHRAESERVRTSALLIASDEFQRNLDQGALHRAICERAMEVTGAARATFVTWDGDRQSGTVAAATDYQRVRPGTPLSERSLVAQACRERQRFAFDDLGTAPAARIFADGETRGRVGSLAIVPLVQEHHTIGALVVEGADARPLGPDAAGTLALLATVAVPSLDASRKLLAESARAFTDSLTGLANRRAFDERLEHLIASADRHGGGVALILADIDHFKSVNDTHGHDAGDAVLRQVSQLIGRSVRAIDLAARYGGEEIAILLPKTGVDGARELAERLRQEIERKPVVVRGSEIPVTVSFGVSSYPESTSSREALFTTADAALYEAKSCGRNQVRSARQTAGNTRLVELI